MQLHRAVVAAAAASMMTVVAFAADNPPQGACPPAHFGGGFMGSLTPEQRMMRFELMRQQTANLTDDQRHAWRDAERAKFEAMSEADKQKYAASLTAQWNALPADQKAEIQKRSEQFHADHPRPPGCN